MNVELKERLEAELRSPAEAPTHRSADIAAIRLVQRAGWICFECKEPLSPTTADSPEVSLRNCLGRLGLWRVVRQRDQLTSTFELPADLVADVPDDESAGVDSTSRLAQAETWAAATLAGHFRESEPLSEEQVRSWIPPRGLTVERGSIALQGRVIRNADRLAISFPLLAGPLPELSPRRTAWLHAVLADAQDRWRMVRLGIDGGGSESGIEAEIDLTGAPSSMVEPLFRRSLTALQFVVRWLAPSVALIADRDAGVALDELDPPAVPQQPAIP
jgi:hypothetical protein